MPLFSSAFFFSNLSNSIAMSFETSIPLTSRIWKARNFNSKSREIKSDGFTLDFVSSLINQKNWTQPIQTYYFCLTDFPHFEHRSIVIQISHWSRRRGSEWPRFTKKYLAKGMLKCVLMVKRWTNSLSWRLRSLKKKKTKVGFKTKRMKTLLFFVWGAGCDETDDENFLLFI